MLKSDDFVKQFFRNARFRKNIDIRNFANTVRRDLKLILKFLLHPKQSARAQIEPFRKAVLEKL